MFKRLAFLLWISLATLGATSQGVGVGSDQNAANVKTAYGFDQVSSLVPQVTLRFNYGLNTRLYTDMSSNSGTFTIANGLATVASGTNSAGVGAMHSKSVLSYDPGQGARIRFSAGFSPCLAGSEVYAGITDGVDGFMFGCDGAAYGLAIIKDGAITWHAKSTWSVDPLDGSGPSGMTIDPTKLNIYQIQYQWLGAGAINYFVEDADTGVLILVHVIKFTNRFLTPSISNPTLPVALHAENKGATTSSTIISSSMAAFTEGNPHSGGVINAIGTGEISYLTASGEEPIITIRSRSTYQSKTNRIEVGVLDISFSSAGTKGVEFKAYLSPALTSASFSDVNTNESVIEVDVAATAITGGSKLVGRALAKDDAKDIDTSSWDLVMQPGDSITITAESAGNSVITADFIWSEKF